MNAWDELNEDEKKEEEKKVSENRGDSLDDGFSDHPDENQNDNDEVVDVVEEKKKNSIVPKLIAGALGVVVLSVVGYFGVTIYSKFVKPAPQARVIESQEINPLSDPSQRVGVSAFDDADLSRKNIDPSGALASAEKSDSLAVAPAAMDPIASLPATAVPAQVIAATPAAAQPDRLTVVEPVAQIVEKKDDGLSRKISDLDKRMTSIESSLSKLTETVSKVQSAPPQVTGSVDKPALKPRPVKTQATKKNNAGKEIPKELDKPVELKLQLRGVYPPRGEDKQAWVLDPATNVITVVTKGEKVQGMTVMQIGSDYILTDRGIIR